LLCVTIGYRQAFFGCGRNEQRSTLDLDGAFARYHPSLFRYLQRLTGDADMAADMAQESFVRLLGRPLPEERVRAWLFTVATNLVRDSARARARRGRLLAGQDLLPDGPPRPDEAVEREEAVASVRRALDRLTPRERQLLLLRQEGFRYLEIAEILQVAPGSVGKLLTRALQRFAEVYGASGYETIDEDDASHS
jgi:RNA polymerase sigma-70 factor (ECF subfamily)